MLPSVLARASLQYLSTDPALGSDVRYASATLLNSPKPDVSGSLTLAAGFSGVCLVYRLYGRARDSSYCPMW